jgi:hypothetical protein
MNSQSLSRLLQGTYQGLGSQDGIVDLRPPVLSSRDEFKSEPHEPFLIPRSNGRRAPLSSTSSNLGDRTTSLCTTSCTAVTTYVVYFVPRAEVQRCFGMIVSVHKRFEPPSTARRGGGGVETA